MELGKICMNKYWTLTPRGNYFSIIVDFNFLYVEKLKTCDL